MAAVPVELEPFNNAVLAPGVQELYGVYTAAQSDGMSEELLAALRVVCASRKAQLLEQDAEALRLVETELGAIAMVTT